jgi:hypothetical protein
VRRLPGICPDRARGSSRLCQRAAWLGDSGHLRVSGRGRPPRHWHRDCQQRPVPKATDSTTWRLHRCATGSDSAPAPLPAPWSDDDGAQRRARAASWHARGHSVVLRSVKFTRAVRLQVSTFHDNHGPCTVEVCLVQSSTTMRATPRAASNATPKSPNARSSDHWRTHRGTRI